MSVAGLTVTSTAGLGAPMLHVCISGSLGVLEWIPGARAEAEEEDEGERKEEVREALVWFWGMDIEVSGCWRLAGRSKDRSPGRLMRM